MERTKPSSCRERFEAMSMLRLLQCTGHVKADCYHEESYCNICGKQGHLAKMCKQRKSKGKNKGKPKGTGKGKGHPMHCIEEVDVAEEITAKVIMGISCETPDDNVVAAVEDCNSLMCDSGCIAYGHHSRSFCKHRCAATLVSTETTHCSTQHHWRADQAASATDPAGYEAGSSRLGVSLEILRYIPREMNERQQMGKKNQAVLEDVGQKPRACQPHHG
eukprot:2233658-Amphidinium_carterae.1